MPFFDLSEQEERSFLSIVRHTVLEGPLRLARFSDWMWVMSIPRGATLNAYFGFAKFQPKISEKAQVQLVTRIGDLEKKWIAGPIRTLEASSRKLKRLAD